MEHHNQNSALDRGNEFADNHKEFRHRLARGWNVLEAELGKNWDSKYPYFARWVERPDLDISIYADLNTGETSLTIWHKDKATRTLLLEEKTYCATEEDVHEKLDSCIKDWIENNGDILYAKD